MARHRELPPSCDHALVSRVQAIESVCRGGAGAEAYATPTHTADLLSVRERQVLQLIADSNATEAVAPKPMRKRSGQPRDPARDEVGVLTVSGNS
jgi:hypothetical protein